MRTLWIVAAGWAACVSGQAAAGELFATSGGWEIYRESDACWLQMTFDRPGDTEVRLFKGVDGHILSSVTNTQWSARKGTEYKISYDRNGMSYSGSTNVGMEGGGGKGFVSALKPEFENAFAASASLQIYLDDQLIEDLSLAGTAAAVTTLNQCLERVRVVPRGDPGLWMTIADYPLQALREDREGTTGYRLTVGTDGRVTDCRIVSSSGHADLDAAACDNVRRRARFRPATDKDGNATPGTYESKVRFAIPRD